MVTDTGTLLMWQPLRQLVDLYQASADLAGQREMRDRVIGGGICAVEGNPEVFFPDKGRTDTAIEAIQVCLGCPVRTECLILALHQGEQYGIFGGTTPRDRQALIRVIKSQSSSSAVPVAAGRQVTRNAA